jgi:hypothetical protein
MENFYFHLFQNLKIAANLQERLESLTSGRIEVCWNISPYRLEDMYWRLGETSCSHKQDNEGRINKSVSKAGFHLPKRKLPRL